MAKVILFNRKVVTHISASGETRPLIYEASIPPQTIRFRFEETDYNPSEIENGGTWTKVADSSFNDWDWYCADTNWKSKFDSYNGWAFTEEHKVSIIATGDMTNVTSMESMFHGCTGLTNIPENSFNNVTNAKLMFDGCTGLTNIPENSFNNVTDASGMFYRCTGLTNIPMNSFNNVTNAYAMFYECTGLTSIPENSFNNVTNAGEMFIGCTGLTSIPDNMFNNVTNAYGMFDECTGLTSIPENSLNNVTAVSYMFRRCTGLTSIGNNSFNNVYEAQGMFYGCTRVEHGALALYNKWIAGGKVISHINTFTDCGKDTTTGLAELQQIPVDWGGLKVELPSNTFRF